jgi:UDP-glucose 4-epimerase
LEERILVTGASGYLGQHLITSLAQGNLTLRGFARSAKPNSLPAIEWLQGDIRHLHDVEQAMQECHGVVHLACSPLGLSFEDPVNDFQVNAQGTLNVLQAARTRGVHRVIYISTAQVYGFTDYLPISEETPTRPTSPYAASKLCGEILCTTFARCYGLHTTILRLFNVYGSSVDGSHRKTVETLFIQRVIQGLPPVIRGDSTQGRDFIHVSDVVRAIQLSLTTNEKGMIINIGTGVMTTLLELAELVIKLAGSQLYPILESTDSPCLRLQADVSKARDVLNFRANVSLLEGLVNLMVGEQLSGKI